MKKYKRFRDVVSNPDNFIYKINNLDYSNKRIVFYNETRFQTNSDEFEVVAIIEYDEILK